MLAAGVADSCLLPADRQKKDAGPGGGGRPSFPHYINAYF